MNSDEKWMQVAIEEAKLAILENEIPVGAVLVQKDKLIAKAHNQPISKNDPTAHAEIEVLRNAGLTSKNYRLPKTTLYVTLEPCLMCLGAMIHARVERLVFGASDTKNELYKSSSDIIEEINLNHKIKISGGILEEDCKHILNSFFKLRRNNL